MATSEQQQLLEAVNALYHHPDTKVKEQANKWLQEWQNSTTAWSIADRVLHDASTSMEAQYFSAQTLRTKVQRDFEELPGAAALALRDSLVELALRFGRGAPPVRTQLCLALAAFAAHQPAGEWGPSGAVGWLAQRLGGQPEDRGLPALLELLTILPQEAGSYRPAVRPERRRQMVDEMIAATPQALTVLSTCLSQHGDNVRTQVLEAFGAWLKLAAGSGLDGGALAGQPLVAAALDGLRDSTTFDAAVDATVELVYVTAARGSPEPAMMPLVTLLVPAVMALRPRFAVAAQRSVARRSGHSEPDGGEFDDDDDTAKGMARLFAEIGEAYASIIATGAPEGMRIAEALLEVASYPDDNIAAMTFNFWHRLSRFLTSAFSPQPIEGADSQQIASEEGQRRIAQFTPLFEQLIVLIRGRVRFPDDWARWHRDERGDFKRARVGVGDTLLDAAAVVGGERALALLMEPLQQLGAQIAAGGQFDWRAAEAALYCIRAVHRVAPPPASPLLLSLFSSLPTLPVQAQVQYTAALMVGAYADWLAHSVRAGAPAALLPQLLQMLTRALYDAEAASAAALAIRHICDACGSYLGTCLEALMQLYQQIQSSGAASTGAGEGTLKLQEKDVQQVVEGMALVVGAQPPEQRRQYLAALLRLVVAPLQYLLTQPDANGVPPGSAAAVGDRQELLLSLVDRMTILFRHIDEPSAVADSFVEVWPTVEAAFDRYNADAHAVERLSRAPRYALRTAGKAAAPMLPLLANWLPQRFASTRQSCLLYVASELVKIFGDDASMDTTIGQLFTRMMGDACTSLQRLPDFDAAPDVADDTFLLAGRALSYHPRIVFTPALLPRLLDCAAAGMLVQHREACLSILSFVTRVFEHDTISRGGPEAASVLQAAALPRSPGLVRLLLAGAAGALPPNRSPDVAAVLNAMVKATGQQGVQWVASAVALLPDTAATPADSDRFISVVASSATQQMGAATLGQLEDAVEELGDLCRRNRRAQEGALRALLPPDLFAHLQRDLQPAA